jgi:hypothetical protein
MSRRLTVLFFTLSFLTCIYLIGRMQSAQAQRTSATDNSANQKWEYCAITSSGSMNENELAVGIATIAYFDRSGPREENIKIQGDKVGKPADGEYQRAQKKSTGYDYWTAWEPRMGDGRTAAIQWLLSLR